MNNISDDTLFDILLSIIERSDDFTEIKEFCAINKQFSRICQQDYLWYQVYKLIDPRIEFDKPFYGTWKDTILEGRTIFTTDRLMREGIKEIVTEFTELVEMANGDIDQIITDLSKMTIDYLDQYSGFVHKFQAFWWLTPDFELNLSKLTKQLNDYLNENNVRSLNPRDSLITSTELDNLAINPYGKLYFNYHNSLWHLRRFWEKYGIMYKDNTDELV